MQKIIIYLVYNKVTTQTISIQKNGENNEGPATLIQNEDIRTFSFTSQAGDHFGGFQQPLWQSSQKAVQSGQPTIENDKFELSEIDSGFNSTQFGTCSANSQSGKIS